MQISSKQYSLLPGFLPLFSPSSWKCGPVSNRRQQPRPLFIMASADSDVSPSPRARCSSCSKESRIKLNSCAGCLNAPSYGGDVPRPAVYYCSAQCQRSHWRTHKTECKVLQTRRCIHRAALVLGSFVGIVEAKGDMSMARLAVFMTELFKGKGHETESPLSSNPVFSPAQTFPSSYKKPSLT